MAAVTDIIGPDYVPPAERIATVDNDGTLWVEQPAPAQTALLTGRMERSQIRQNHIMPMPKGMGFCFSIFNNEKLRS